VLVTLTGTNFAAPPPPSGTGGSIVYIAQPALPWGTDTGCPNSQTCQPIEVPPADVTVVSPTEIQVSFDTRSAPAGYSYDLMVWNPGLPPVPPATTSPPQVSNILPGAFTISP
jgi:hypothetical protein